MKKTHLSFSSLFADTDLSPPLEIPFYSLSMPQIINLLLIFIGIVSLFIWCYSLLTLKIADMMPENFIFEVRRLMLDKRYDKALAHCYQNKTPTANLIAKGMESRKRGYQNVVDAIQNEGQRRQKSLGDKVQLLRKISLAAPFIGILGAFAALYFSYTNTIEAGSFLSFFLVGITPAIIGLVVSIISWVFYVTLQKRIYFLMNTIINEVLTLVRTVDIDYR